MLRAIVFAHLMSVGRLDRASRATPAMLSSAFRAETIAIVGATVLPMDRDRTLRDQTVLVVGGRIVAVGERGRIATTGARVIDAAGRFLMPGLVDAHTHSLFRRDGEQYVAAGVTTIFDLGSFDENGLIALRDSSARGLIVGPSILMGYFVDGPATARGRRTINTPAEARAAVAAARARGFQFIKAYNSIPEDAALALLAEAKRQHMPVIGHSIRSIGLRRGLSLGQQAVAHAEEYFYGTIGDIRSEQEWNDAVTFTRAAGAYVIPNLSAYGMIERQWGRRDVLDSILALPATASLESLWQREWKRGPYLSRSGTLQGRTAILRQFVKKLSDAGVPLMAGTDSPGIPGLFPGPSLLLDLRELASAGLTPFQALSAATRTPGELANRYVAHAERFGTITVGARADLVLLDVNPLDDLSALERPRGVMIRGRWLARPALDSLGRR